MPVKLLRANMLQHAYIDLERGQRRREMTAYRRDVMLRALFGGLSVGTHCPPKSHDVSYARADGVNESAIKRTQDNPTMYGNTMPQNILRALKMA